MRQLICILYDILICCRVLCLNALSIENITILNILYYRILLTRSSFMVTFGKLMSCLEESKRQVKISCKLNYLTTIIGKI